MFSNIHRGNFHTNVTAFQGEMFVDIAKPVAFDVISSSKKLNNFCSRAIVV